MDNLALNLAQFIKEKSGVSRLTLTDFRNYAHLRINAKLAPIIITGENGTGKTNILEAISFLTPAGACARRGWLTLSGLRRR